MDSITDRRALGRWALTIAAAAGLALAACGGDEDTFPSEAPLLPTASATTTQSESQQDGSTSEQNDSTDPELPDDPSVPVPQDVPDDPTIAPDTTGEVPDDPTIPPPATFAEAPDGPTVPASSSPPPADPPPTPGCDGGWVAITNSGSSSDSVAKLFAEQARTALGDGSIDVIDGGSCPSLPPGSMAIGPFSSAEDAVAACQIGGVVAAGDCFATPLTTDVADSDVRVAAG